MTKTELIQALRDKGVAFDLSMTKDELELLLKQSEVQPVQSEAPTASTTAPIVVEPTSAAPVVVPPTPQSKVPDTIAVDGKMFSKLVYDLTQGYTAYWTGVSGRTRLMEMCGATNKQEVEAMYGQLKEKYLRKQ